MWWKRAADRRGKYDSSRSDICVIQGYTHKSHLRSIKKKCTKKRPIYGAQQKVTDVEKASSDFGKGT